MNTLEIKKKALTKHNKKNIGINFIKVINAYHKIFRRLIKGGIWEDLFENILMESKINVISRADTKQTSGRDLQADFGWVSNKTVKLKKKKMVFIRFRFLLIV
jgi:hypothetical protein